MVNVAPFAEVVPACPPSVTVVVLNVTSLVNVHAICAPSVVIEKLFVLAVVTVAAVMLRVVSEPQDKLVPPKANVPLTVMLIVESDVRHTTDVLLLNDMLL